jgi:hypothetical protein
MASTISIFPLNHKNSTTQIHTVDAEAVEASSSCGECARNCPPVKAAKKTKIIFFFSLFLFQSLILNVD